MCEPEATEDLLTLRLWRFRPTLMRQARRRLPSRAWAEDAVSETLLAAVERREQLGALSSLEGWLMAVLQHKICDQQRLHGGWIDTVPTGFEERADPDAADPERTAAWRQWIRQIERQMQRLPPQQAQALQLHLADEAGTAEIALALGVTTNHSSVLLHRARRRMQQLLTNRLPE